MVKYGLTLSSEEHPPEHLVETARVAEAADFDFVSISDHFHPWLEVQGHSPFVWSVRIKQEIVDTYHHEGGEGPIYSQLTLCWDPDRDRALERATRQWANTALPGQLAQDLRTVLHFEQAVQLVDEKMIEEQMNVGPDPEPILKSIGQAVDAGIDHVYLHQVGDPLDGFIDFWETELRPNLG